MFMETIRDFIAFLIRPSFSVRTHQSWRLLWRPLLVILSLKLVVTYTLIAILSYYKGSVGFEREEIESVLGEEWWQILLLAVIVGPVAEEMIFRGPLTRRPVPVLIGASAAAALGTYFLIVFVFESFGWPLSLRRIALLSLPFASAGLVFWIICRFQKQDRLGPLLEKALPFLFYGMAVAFGLFHLNNYATDWLLAAPMALNPFFGAVVYGFARIKWGLLPAVLLHMGNNGVAFFLDVVLA